MPSCGPRSWWRMTTTSAEDSSAFSVARSATRSRGGLRREGGPARAEPLAEQQRVDAAGLEAAEHLVDARRRAPAGAQAVLEPVQQLALARGARAPRSRAPPRPHLVDARVLDVDGGRGPDALLQVGVQVALEIADGLVGRADQQVLEALALEQVEDDAAVWARWSRTSSSTERW